MNLNQQAVTSEYLRAGQRKPKVKAGTSDFSPDLNIVTYAFGSELSHVTCDATRLL